MIFTILYWAIVFVAGFCSGWLIKTYILARREYVGTMVVTHDKRTAKTVYSLVLDEYPEKLEFKKVVMLKVDSSDENS